MASISLPVENGYMCGGKIRFTVNALEYSGHVHRDRIEGIAKGHITSAWTAIRKQ